MSAGSARCHTPAGQLSIRFAMETRRWDLKDAGGAHVVEIPVGHPAGTPVTFFVDGDESRLPGHLFQARRIARFGVGDHAAMLERHVIRRSFRSELRRQFGRQVRYLPSTILASLEFGQAGAAATTSVVGAFGHTTAWVAYSLTVDGSDRGSWVATQVDRVVAAWTFVAPGDPLPAASDSTWPNESKDTPAAI